MFSALPVSSRTQQIVLAIFEHQFLKRNVVSIGFDALLDFGSTGILVLSRWVNKPFLELSLIGHPIICDPALFYLRGSLLLFHGVDVIFDLEYLPRRVHVGTTGPRLVLLLCGLDRLVALFAVDGLRLRVLSVLRVLRSSNYHTALVASSLLLLLSTPLLFRLLT